MNKSKIPTILGIFILVIGVAVGVYVVGRSQVFKLGASGELNPKDVRITNITDTSFSVSWATDKETLGYLQWGENTSLGKTEADVNTTPSLTHSVTIKNLSSAKQYFFKINSGGVSFDNNSAAWKTQTAPSLPPPAVAKFLSGVVNDSDGGSVANAIVYVNISGAEPLSTITSAKGEWIVPLLGTRTANLDSYANYKDDDLVEIFVQAGGNKIASAQVLLSRANPTPTISIGKIHDFRNSQTTIQEANPQADLSLPDIENELESLDQEAKKSGFDLSTPGGTPANSAKDTVTLESVNNGEVVYSNRPEFFGDAPAGSTLSITVHSDPVSASVKVPSSGSWSWEPPKGLEPGEHTITITWRDGLGILRSLERTFIVEVSAQTPAFESTPSGTLSPLPSATPTATKTPSPSTLVTATPKPTSMPTLVPSATPAGSLPESGGLTPTLVLISLGCILLAFSVIIKVTENT